MGGGCGIRRNDVSMSKNEKRDITEQFSKAERKQTHRHREQTVVAQGEGRGPVAAPSVGRTLRAAEHPVPRDGLGIWD